MKPELLDNSLSLWLSNSHVSPLFFSLSFVFYVIFSTLPQACKEAIWPSVRQRRWQNAPANRHFHSVDKDFTKSFFLPGNCGSIRTHCEHLFGLSFIYFFPLLCHRTAVSGGILPLDRSKRRRPFH